MMANGKDSTEVVKFLTLFSKLKDWCDDDPNTIFEQAVTDAGFRELCRQFLNVAERLHGGERRRRNLFAAPVDPKFLSAWRDFETRYEHVLAANWSVFEFGDKNATLADQSQRTLSADRKWAHADLNGKIAADLIEKAIGLARIATSDDDERIDPDYSLSAEQAVEMATVYWESLADEMGFDLAGIFRRRRLVPFIFFPRHIAARLGAPEKTTLYQSLQQAHDAFVYGVPFAALALMRSIMETVLRDHYDAQGNDLSEQINSVRASLPRGANEVALHRLRRLANSILHGSLDIGEALVKLDAVQTEKEIVSLLLVLRALIEGAPQKVER